MRLAVLILALGGCAGAGFFQERLLATIPEDSRVNVPVSFSVDGGRAAWVERRGDSSLAICGGRSGKPYGLLC